MINKNNKFILRCYSILRLFGFDPLQFMRSLGGIGFYIRNYFSLKKQRGDDNTFPFGRIYPILGERNTESGTMSGHYFHQDLFVANRIFNINPERHIDIGSRTDGFVAHVASFRKIEIIDIRDQKSKVKNIEFRQADLMELPDDMINSCDSISALHSIEHFGLGRYGDPIDYFGHLKAIKNISRIVKSGGRFYFSAPIGSQRIEFNAHRVFSVEYVMNLFNENFNLIGFSFVDDKGDLFEDVALNEKDVKNNFGCSYGCGIFELIKK